MLSPDTDIQIKLSAGSIPIGRKSDGTILPIVYIVYLSSKFISAFLDIGKNIINDDVILPSLV
ncbi:hypothetical protein D3C76_1785360 [compost metagenome]